MSAGVEKDKVGISITVSYLPAILLEELHHSGGIDAILRTSVGEYICSLVSSHNTAFSRA
jgi:hypothetical protein